MLEKDVLVITYIGYEAHKTFQIRNRTVLVFAIRLLRSNLRIIYFVVTLKKNS